ncbi:MAG: tRNA-specific adenosine deaminase [Desulfobulbus propionicus]|nr:MAG: tRNA-specific adenosine deaminase [Desulfobulbus propionicus]
MGNSWSEFDHQMMRKALHCAHMAADMGEVPVGAVLVGSDMQVIASCGNNCIKANDPTGHAEIRVLRKAGQAVNNYRFPGSALYVTLEPCVMCAAALVNARVERVIFGALDPKGGGVVSRYFIGRDGQLNHSFKVTYGVLAGECSEVLRNFFKKRR